MQTFADLMNDLGDLLDTTIVPDIHQVCCLVINQSFKVNIEMSVTGEEILLACFIVELPPGRFREEILRDALKANHKSDLNLGILAYVGQENALTLFQTVQAYPLSANDLYKHLLLFVERAKGWKEAINSGMTGPQSTGEIPKSEESGRPTMFGFK